MAGSRQYDLAPKPVLSEHLVGCKQVEPHAELRRLTDHAPHRFQVVLECLPDRRARIVTRIGIGRRRLDHAGLGEQVEAHQAAAVFPVIGPVRGPFQADEGHDREQRRQQKPLHVKFPLTAMGDGDQQQDRDEGVPDGPDDDSKTDQSGKQPDPSLAICIDAQNDGGADRDRGADKDRLGQDHEMVLVQDRVAPGREHRQSG